MGQWWNKESLTGKHTEANRRDSSRGDTGVRSLPEVYSGKTDTSTTSS